MKNEKASIFIIEAFSDFRWREFKPPGGYKSVIEQSSVTYTLKQIFVDGASSHLYHCRHQSN